MTPVLPDPIEPKAGKFPRWVGALPGILMVTFFAVRALVQMGQVSRVIGGADASQGEPLACVEAYGVTLTNSEFYVPEGQQFTPPKTPQLSTVVSGMVRNDCGEPLKSVTIHLNVRDDGGKRGDGAVTIFQLNPGEAKPFSKAWMGRVASWEIAKIQ